MECWEDRFLKEAKSDDPYDDYDNNNNIDPEVHSASCENEYQGISVGKDGWA